MAESGPLLGAELELTVDAVAQGGACVARHEGRVVFVRHTLPGEVVRARVTEDRGGSFCRADAIEILRPAPDRVEPPCPYAGPSRCGGCDWQHASAAAQLQLKSDVVRQQFLRLAHLDASEFEALFGGVEALPGGLLGWRTRVLFAVDADGRPGLHRHHSRTLEHVESCVLGVPRVGDASVLADRWPGLSGVEVARGDDGQLSTLSHRPGPGRQARGRRPPDRVKVIAGPDSLVRRIAGHDLEVSAGGFWQVHPDAADVLSGALLAAVAPQPGERVLDLYAGAGALTAVLADAVGPVGRVQGVESDAGAVTDAAANLADRPWAEVIRGRVGAIETMSGPIDLVVLDPPRAGAGKEVMGPILGSGARAIGYVSCDPATLARDVAIAREHGWRLSSLRAFDAFPMTHHVECVAALVPSDVPANGALPSAP